MRTWLVFAETVTKLMFSTNYTYVHLMELNVDVLPEMLVLILPNYCPLLSPHRIQSLDATLNTYVPLGSAVRY